VSGLALLLWTTDRPCASHSRHACCMPPGADTSCLLSLLVPFASRLFPHACLCVPPSPTGPPQWLLPPSPPSGPVFSTICSSVLCASFDVCSSPLQPPTPLPPTPDSSAAMAVASLSPLWGGLQHGLLAGALRFVNATPDDSPDYGSVVWGWALSRQACDRWAARALIRQFCHGSVAWGWALPRQACDGSDSCLRIGQLCLRSGRAPAHARGCERHVLFSRRPRVVFGHISARSTPLSLHPAHIIS
jgi:hypothetical protein